MTADVVRDWRHEDIGICFYYYLEYAQPPEKSGRAMPDPRDTARPNGERSNPLPAGSASEPVFQMANAFMFSGLTPL
jgi:hypothetical protein